MVEFRVTTCEMYDEKEVEKVVFSIRLNESDCEADILCLIPIDLEDWEYIAYQVWWKLSHLVENLHKIDTQRR